MEGANPTPPAPPQDDPLPNRDISPVAQSYMSSVPTNKRLSSELNDWIHDVQRKRMKRDVSKLFFVPYIDPSTTPCSPQPDQMTIQLYPYQRRAVFKMMQIEAGVTVNINRCDIHPRGGVVCDAVGMGKTAEVLALCLLKPLRSEEDSSHFKANLVICPEHLCSQWTHEAIKLTPSLNILPLYEAHQLRNASRSRIREADVIVTSLKVFTEGFVLNSSQFNIPTHCVYHRIIVDECHDAVALGNSITSKLSSMRCNHFWCVTGTPFPQGDDSAYGINQLLHIKIKFHLSKGIFNLPNKFLPPDHPFEVLKRNIYVRNDPRSSRVELQSDQDMVNAYTIEVIELQFADVEWAFYNEESRQIYSRNIFSDAFNALRQLCCHPACSSKWMKRLSGQSLYHIHYQCVNVFLTFRCCFQYKKQCDLITR